MLEIPVRVVEWLHWICSVYCWWVSMYVYAVLFQQFHVLILTSSLEFCRKFHLQEYDPVHILNHCHLYFNIFYQKFSHSAFQTSFWKALVKNSTFAKPVLHFLILSFVVSSSNFLLLFFNKVSILLNESFHSFLFPVFYISSIQMMRSDANCTLFVRLWKHVWCIWLLAHTDSSRVEGKFFRIEQPGSKRWHGSAL